jgi:hypothetical protein
VPKEAVDEGGHRRRSSPKEHSIPGGATATRLAAVVIPMPWNHRRRPHVQLIVEVQPLPLNEEESAMEVVARRGGGARHGHGGGGARHGFSAPRMASSCGERAAREREYPQKGQMCSKTGFFELLQEEERGSL